MGEAVAPSSQHSAQLSPHRACEAPSIDDEAYAFHLEALQGSTAAKRFHEGLDLWLGHVLPDDLDARILDFGCGRGDLLGYLSAKGYRRIEGLDVISSYAGTISANTGVPVHVVADGQEWLHGVKESYDVIVFKDVLEHIPCEQIVPLLATAREALTPGGWVIVSGPHAGSVTGLYTRYADFTHTTCFTAPSLAYAFRAAGFAREEVVMPRRRWGHRPTRWALEAARGVWFSAMRLIYFVESPGDPGNPPHFYNRLVMRAWRDS